jgi:hypothetical protein
MPMKACSASCHCRAVRFQAELDFAEGTFKCNCSSCTKARSWLIAAPAARFRLEGEADQATYQWTPPGRAKPTTEFHFCKKCGIRTPARGEHEAMGGAFYAAQVSLLDDLDPEEVAAAPIRYFDGRHDRFDRAPEDIRFL